MFTLVNLIVIISMSILYYDFGMTKHEYLIGTATCLFLQFTIALADLVRSIVRTIAANKEGC